MPGVSNGSPRDVDLLKQAVAAHRAGGKAQARELLIAASEINPNNELVWLWRSSVATGYREAVDCLNRVLDLNPSNVKAQQWMEKLKAARAEALRRAGLPPDQEEARAKQETSANGTGPTLVPAETEQAAEAQLQAESAETAPAETAPAETAPADTAPADTAPAEEEDDPLRRLLAEKSEQSPEARDPFADETAEAQEDSAEEKPEASDSERERARAASLEALFGEPARGDEAEDGTPAEAQQEAVAEQQAEPLAEEPSQAASEPAAEGLACPVCEASWTQSERICPTCRSITDPILVEEAPQHEGADRSSLREAEKRLVSLVENAPSFEAFRALGLVYLNLRQSNDALEQFREAHRLDPQDEHVRQAVIALEQRKLILAVDDSKTVQRMISSVLEKERYRVAIAGDGLQALARLDDEMPALVLLDITMPRMDGYQTCKVISGNEATKHIPVVMLSGKDGFFDKVRGRMVGASNYITKPFEPASLLKAIRKQMED